MKIKSYTELVNPPKFKIVDIVRYTNVLYHDIFTVVKVGEGLYVNYYSIENDKKRVNSVSENSLEEVPDYEVDAMKYNM